jgi:PII-like signaling protein
VWHKLTVHAGEDARHGRHAVHLELVHRLRRAGAAGATSLRGIWGYTDDGRPHADVALGLPRRVPVVTVIVDRAAQAQRWLAVVDDLTDRAGLVTRELVPAFHAVSRGARRGDLRLAGPMPPQ